MSGTVRRKGRQRERQWQQASTPSELPEFARPLKLICGACGESGSYRVGRVIVAEAIAQCPNVADMDKYVGFTRYFRCRGCDAGGPWRLDDSAKMQILAVLVLDSVSDEADRGVYVGEMRTFDGRRSRYPTEGEAHIKELIEREPERAFLWVRLGNVYKHGDRAEWAEQAYRRAIELAPEEPEAYVCLADSLRGRGRMKAAVPYWQAALKHVRTATHLPREERLQYVEAAISWLLENPEDFNAAFKSLVEDSQQQAPPRPAGEPLIVDVRSWDLDDPEDFEDVCRLFLGEPARPRRPKPVKDLVPPALCELPLIEPLPEGGSSGASRNAPCPCGSGRKYKKCCGRG